jgi:hypothetical protein
VRSFGATTCRLPSRIATRVATLAPATVLPHAADTAKFFQDESRILGCLLQEPGDAE